MTNTPDNNDRHEREWQPIETAPKNKAVLLAKGRRVGEGCYIDYPDGDGHSGWFWADDRDPMENVPSHWQPLPAPPNPHHFNQEGK